MEQDRPIMASDARRMAKRATGLGRILVEEDKGMLYVAIPDKGTICLRGQSEQLLDSVKVQGGNGAGEFKSIEEVVRYLSDKGVKGSYLPIKGGIIDFPTEL